MGRWIRVVGVGVLLSSLAVCLMGSDACGLGPAPCENELVLGHVYEVTLVDDYTADGAFLVDRVPDLGMLPSCMRRDGLGVGASFRIRIGNAPRGFPCGANATVVSGITGIDFSSPLFRNSASAFEIATVDYSLIANRERLPYVGARPTHGLRPPLQVIRTTRTCGDVFVAQIFEVEEADAGDARIDAR